MIKRRSRFASVHLAFAAAACAWVITLGASAIEDLERDGRRQAASIESTGEAASSESKAPHATGAQATQVDKRPSAPSDGCIGCHKTTRDPHPTPQSLSCADCHGGNGTATTKEQAHPRPRNRGRVADRGQPDRELHAVEPRAARVDSLRESVGPARGAGRLRPLPFGDCAHGAEGPDGEQRAGVQHRPVQQRVGAVQRRACSSRTTRRAACRRSCAPCRRRRRRRRGRRASCRSSSRCRDSKSASPARSLRAFERGGGPKSELGNPNREDVPGQPDVTVSNRGFGTQGSVDPVILGAQKVRLNDPVLSFLGTNDCARRLSQQRLRVVPRDLRERSRSVQLGSVREVRQPGLTAERRPDDQQDGIGSSDSPRVHAQDSVEPVHHLPRAQRQRFPQHLPRLHVVGRANRR